MKYKTAWSTIDHYSTHDVGLIMLKSMKTIYTCIFLFLHFVDFFHIDKYCVCTAALNVNDNYEYVYRSMGTLIH